MKFLLGCLMMLAGAALGIYVGLWLLLIGGVVQVFAGFQAAPANGLDVAIGAAKILCAAPVGWLTAVVAIFPGFAVATAE